MNKDSKIFIAGHTGLVGSAIMHNLQIKGYSNIITRTHSELDLLEQNAVITFFEEEKPEYVILAAAKVGGIVANSLYRGQFIYENLQIQNNVIHQAYIHGVKKLLFLGSSCIYPKHTPQPITEECLLTSALEPSNEPYAIAKIAGLKMCEAYNQQYSTDYIVVMPSNLYGENDNYDLENSHVLPALIRKMHLGKCLQNNDWAALRSDLNRLPIEGITGEAKEEDQLEILAKYGICKTEAKVVVTLWGTGLPFREFLHADDMAAACTYLFEKISAKDIQALKPENPKLNFVNLGTGKDLRIKDLAELVKDIVGFDGELFWDTSKPDGTYKKLLNVSKLNKLGWKGSIKLEDGIRMVYNNFSK